MIGFVVVVKNIWKSLLYFSSKDRSILNKNGKNPW